MNGLKCIQKLTESTKCSLTVVLFIICLVSGQTVRSDVKSHPNWKLLDRGEDCGLSASNRIIGGKIATLGQYPWMARIGFSAVDRFYSDVEMYYTCGGTIINDRYVLTAAHCSPHLNFPDWLHMDLVQVRLGEHDASSDSDCENGVCALPAQDVNVEEYFCHPGYETVEAHDDICLVRLARPIQFNKYVYPICLPVYDWFLNKNFEDTTMEVAGWGYTDPDLATSSDVLLTLMVPVVSNAVCQQEFNGHSRIIDKQLCAGGVLGRDSCKGDSGGPLMASLSVDGPPRYYLMGVVSYGDPNCGKTRSPGVYTKITEYLTWILDHIKE